MPLEYLKRSAFLWLASFIALLALLRSWGFFQGLPPGDIARSAPEDRVLVAGEVEGYPRPSRGGTAFVLRVESVEGEPASGNLWVETPAVPRGLSWGDAVSVRGNLRRPEQPATPGGGSFQDYLAGRKIYAELEAGSPQDISLETRARPPALAAGAALRARLLAAFALVPEPGASLLGAVLLGDRSLLPEGTVRAFRDAGAIHFLVAAGLHVGFLLLWVAGLARLLGVSRVRSLILAVAVAGVYVLGCGAGAPLLRGYLMTAAGLAGFLLGRNSGAFQGLVLSCWALLACEPIAAFQPGFQMSFAAAFALVAALPSWRPPASWIPAVRYAATVFLVSLAAQAALWPLAALYFHQVSAAALLSNIALVPMTAVLMAGGFGLFLLEVFGFHGAARFAAAALGFWAKAYLAVVSYFSDLPLRWSVPAPSGGFLAVYACVFLAACALPEFEASLKRLRWTFAALIGSGLIAVLSPSRLRLWFCSDRGAATTVFIRSPGGTRLLVNAGAPGDALADCILDSGSSSLDVLALGCLRPACWSGLPELSREVRVRAVWAPPGPLDGELARLRRELLADGTEWKEMWPGDAGSSGNAVLTLAGGYTGGPRDDFPWTVRWRGFGAEIDSPRGFSAVGSLYSIIKRPTSDRADSARAGLEETALEGGPPLGIETDGRRTRILQTGD